MTSSVSSRGKPASASAAASLAVPRSASPSTSFVGVGDRETKRPAVFDEALELEPGLLGDLALAVGLVTGEQALDRQQDEAILRNRAAQLLEAQPSSSWRYSSSFTPRGTRLLVLEPVEEPLGFPVHVGGTLQKLVGEQVHEQPVVPLAVGLELVAAHHADPRKPTASRS